MASGTHGSVRWRPDHGWLAAVLPAHVLTFRSADAALGETLAASGGEAVSQRPDVELAARARDLRGDASSAVVFTARAAREGSGVAVRVAGRLSGAALVGAEAARAARRMRRLGHSEVAAIPWDQERQPTVDVRAGARARAQEAARLPLSAIVAGRHDRGGPTIFDEALRSAGAESVVPRAGLSGVVLAVGPETVVRAVLRAGADQVERGLDVLEVLRSASDEVRSRIAWPHATGTLPLATWVAEPRLPGSPATTPLPPGLGEEAVEFLAALFRTTGESSGTSITDAAAIVAAVCPPAEARSASALGERLEASLADVPRGFAHGDFWSANLLVDGGRLAGVVDWSGGGAGRLPLADLLHLLVAERMAVTDRPLGDVVTGWLLPAVERGELPGVAAYCRRLGISDEAALVRDLALAYWLEHVAAHLSTYADRAVRPGWMGPNVLDVMRAVPGM